LFTLANPLPSECEASQQGVMRTSAFRIVPAIVDLATTLSLK